MPDAPGREVVGPGSPRRGTPATSAAATSSWDELKARRGREDGARPGTRRARGARRRAGGRAAARRGSFDQDGGLGPGHDAGAEDVGALAADLVEQRSTSAFIAL